MGYGIRLKQQRERLGFSQQEVAKRCGWQSRNRISQYELEEREPKGGDFEKLAKALKTTAAWLRFGSIDNASPRDDMDTIVDASMLSKVLTVVAQVEEELQTRLPPEAKADLVAALYDDAKNGAAPDAQRVRLWFRVAQRS